MYTIGIINYINSIPLSYGLETHFTIVKDTPRRLAQRFKHGELDGAFIPSVDYLCHNDTYFRVEGVSISSFGSVGSVFLIKKRGAVIKAVLESSESITSNFIARVIIEKKYGAIPLMFKEHECCQTDARIIIGDTALKNCVYSADEEIMDLGEEWYALTGLPLIYAVSVARDPQSAHRMSGVFIQNLHRNLSSLDAVLTACKMSEYGDYLRKINYGWSELHDISLSTLEMFYRQDNLCTAK